jgi:chromosome segregation ATPase
VKFGNNFRTRILEKVSGVRSQLTVLRGLSSQCRSTLLKTRELRGDYMKMMREKNELGRTNKEMEQRLRRKDKYITQLKGKLEDNNRKQRENEQVEGLKKAVEEIKIERDMLRKEVEHVKDKMQKEVKRSVTEMGMRVSDISENKKTIEREKNKLERKLKNIGKDYQMMSMALNKHQQKLIIMEKERQGLIQVIHQMKEGVDQQVKSFQK